MRYCSVSHPKLTASTRRCVRIAVRSRRPPPGSLENLACLALPLDRSAPAGVMQARSGSHDKSAHDHPPTSAGVGAGLVAIRARCEVCVKAWGSCDLEIIAPNRCRYRPKPLPSLKPRIWLVSDSTVRHRSSSWNDNAVAISCYWKWVTKCHAVAAKR